MTIMPSVESQKGVISAQNVPLRTRRALLLYKVNGNNALRVFTFLSSYKKVKAIMLSNILQ